MKIKPIVFTSVVPSCSTPRQFALWKQAARQHKPNPKVGFCEDCTKEYQTKMIAEKKCENPHVWFCTDEDGFEHGTIKFKEEEFENE